MSGCLASSETPGPKKEAPKPAAPLKAGQKPAPVVEPLVKPHAVDLIFTAEQRGVAQILNALAGNKQQFYITRYVALHNTKDTPPLREAAPVVAAAATTPDPLNPTPPTAPGTPGAPEAKDPIVLGNEKVEVTLRVEIVDFAQPKAEATPAAKVRNAGK